MASVTSAPDQVVVLRLHPMRHTAMRAASFKLPAALDERLTTLARRRGTTRSAVVRDAIEALEDKAPGGSVTEAAGELVGALSGPRDLSTSPGHMAGYGR